MEQDKVFSNSVKYSGILPFKKFYAFCYEWLTEQTGLIVVERQYEESVKGDKKDIKFKWECFRKLTDYFKFDAEIDMSSYGWEKVKMSKNGETIETDRIGTMTFKVDGILTRDYESKFETSALSKTMRAIYEKWIIPSRVDEFQTRVIQGCDGFLGQVKAYMDLEGRK